VAIDTLDRLLLAACIGALLGAFAQLGVQLPQVARLLEGFRLSLSTRVEGVRDALRAFGPVIAARGALQLSIYVDQVLASLAVAGAPSTIRWASTLYILPVSLFAQSVAVAELPELAREAAEGGGARLAERTRFALRQIGFLILPSLVGLLVLGRWIVGALFERGSFEEPHTWLVYLTLAAYSLGLPAVAWSRALVNVFWAQGDTSTPARIAGLRMALAAGAGAGLMFACDRVPVSAVAGGISAPGESLFLGAVGLAAAAALASWLELFLLRAALRRHLPELELPVAAAGGMLLRAGGAMVPAAALAALAGGLGLVPRAVVAVALYVGGYLALSRRSASAELAAWIRR
jgi:putative peptidoglycan lipid II flippase